jgi:hypothetical protein
MRIAIPTLALLCSSAIALAPAQSFNVDVGSVTAVPGASYGAAASQPGLWNQMPDGFGTALVGLGGAATGASVSALGANFAFWANNAGTSGDDELLLDDACDGARIYTFTGLAPGSYTLYTYAWAPDSSSYKTLVSVQGSSSPDQIVGGAWPGGHQLGVTYALHDVSAPAGDIVVTVTASSGFATLNGFQLVDAGGTCPVAQTYCTAKPDSLGCASILSASGVPSASAGSGYTIQYAPVPGGNVGLFVYSTNGPLAVPLQVPFGWLCVATPFFRTPGTTSGGSPGTCSGAFAIDFNAFFAAQTADPSLVAGASVDLQCWFRDPPNPGGANLSNALHFTMCP